MPSSLSVIVPAYNEARRLSKSIPRILEYLNRHYPVSELIVVDDGSSDETIAVADKALENPGTVTPRVIHSSTNRGKGHAVRTGLLAAKSRIALFTDADLSTPIDETEILIQPIVSGQFDLVIGSRNVTGSRIGVHQPLRREMSGRVFNACVRLFTGLRFKDTQCGFKAFRMSICRPIIQAATIDRFAFDVELVYLAHLSGLRVYECPVRWDHNDGSTVSMLRDSLRMFYEVRRLRVQARRGRYLMAIKAAQFHARNGSIRFNVS